MVETLIFLKTINFELWQSCSRSVCQKIKEFNSSVPSGYQLFMCNGLQITSET